ncbi:hypothetical protein [Micromonospora sp. NPDC004704]
MSTFRRRPAVPASELRSQLIANRDLTSVQREDARKRRAQRAEHRDALAAVDEMASAADRARRERIRDEVEEVALADLYRRATRSGARARIRVEMQGSAEMRALRLAKVRSVTLGAGIPVLLAFGAWSTTGAQAGAARLLNLEPGSAAWVASWAVEPALIAVVALIIIGKSVLAASGGRVDWRAGAAEWIALGMSLALNIIGGWHGGWSGLATVLPHAIGPAGCAGTAFLVGLFIGYVADAEPWKDAPRLADLNLMPAAKISPRKPVDAPEETPTDTLTAIVHATAPTIGETVHAEVARQLATGPASQVGPRMPVQKLRGFRTPRPRRLGGRNQPNITVILPPPAHRPAAKKVAPAEPRTGRPSEAQKVLNAAKALPATAPATEVAKRAGVSARTARKHLATVNGTAVS